MDTAEERRSLIIDETNPIDYIIKQPAAYCYIKEFSKDELDKVNQFYSNLDIYKDTITPLTSLPSFSKLININNIYIKDESYRFNLSAFKVLGGLYCIINLLSKIYKNDINMNEINNLNEIKKTIENSNQPKPIIITATDGNHGRGVAWSCDQLGIKSIIYMPKGTVQSRIDNIQMFNTSKVIVTNLNFDDTVKYAFNQVAKYKQQSYASNNNYYVVNTTDNGIDIPLSIFHGYTQIARETLYQLNDIYNINVPTHIILQIGVGGFASSFLSFYKNTLKTKSYSMPKIILFEPMNAAPLYKTAKFNDDNTLQSVDGKLETMMAGLSCGMLTKIGGGILNKYGDCYIRGYDDIAAIGMRILANPIGNDKRILSGESGAAIGIGLLYNIMNKKCYDKLRLHLNLNENSNVLIVNTEGITDYDNWKNVVWFGKSKL